MTDHGIPTEAERVANWQAIQKLSRGNRFRLMFGLPLLPEGPSNEALTPSDEALEVFEKPILEDKL